MDYGQRSQNNGISSNDALFTSGLTEGVGKNPEQTELDAKEGLRSNESWQRNPQAIGNKIINFPNSTIEASDNQSQKERLGVIEPTMPPTMSEGAQTQSSLKTDIIEASLDKTALNTEGRLESAGVKEIDKAISRLNRTGNVADFYETARDAMETNLNNSYNRKLAA